MTRLPDDPLSKALRFARTKKLFGPSERVLVASGGGANSLAVLGFLKLRQAELGIGHLGLVAVDRGGPDDADNVADAGRFARDAGVAFYAVEAEGRSPLKVALDVARREGCGRVALGHTLDDHSLRLFAAIVAGRPLARIRPWPARSATGVVRPLLALHDDEAAWIGRTAGIEVVSLPPEPTRPRGLAERLRSSVVPRLRVEAPGADEAFVALAHAAKSVRIALGELIRGAWIETVLRNDDGQGSTRVVSVDVRAIRAPAVAAIVATQALRALGLDAAAVARVGVALEAVLATGQALRGDVVLAGAVVVGPDPRDGRTGHVRLRRLSRDIARRKPPFG